MVRGKDSANPGSPPADAVAPATDVDVPIEDATSTASRSPELGPGEDEPDLRPVGPRQVRVVAAGRPVAARQLGVTQGPDQGHDAADGPGGHAHGRAARTLKDVLRALVDRRADDDADDQADG